MGTVLIYMFCPDFQSPVMMQKKSRSSKTSQKGPVLGLFRPRKRLQQIITILFAFRQTIILWVNHFIFEGGGGGEGW